VRISLDAAALPLLPGALELARDGVRTGGDRRNREFAGAAVEADVSEELLALAYDPQTAGGLLVSLPARQGPVLEAEFGERRLFLRRVGVVEEGSGVVVE
jgi:selenide,water dikinase